MQLEPALMRLAIEEATRSREKGDYAIGAVVARGSKVIASGTNHAKLDGDSTQHAEMYVIREASKKLGSRFLTDCILYTTHEPCPMCASAAIWARMEGIVFGAALKDMIAYQKQNGTHEWTWRTINIPAKEILAKGEPALELVGEYMREECLNLFHA